METKPSQYIALARAVAPVVQNMAVTHSSLVPAVVLCELTNDLMQGRAVEFGCLFQKANGTLDLNRFGNFATRHLANGFVQSDKIAVGKNGKRTRVFWPLGMSMPARYPDPDAAPGLAVAFKNRGAKQQGTEAAEPPKPKTELMPLELAEDMQIPDSGPLPIAIVGSMNAGKSVLAKRLVQYFTHEHEPRVKRGFFLVGSLAMHTALSAMLADVPGACVLMISDHAGNGEDTEMALKALGVFLEQQEAAVSAYKTAIQDGDVDAPRPLALFYAPDLEDWFKVIFKRPVNGAT